MPIINLNPTTVHKQVPCPFCNSDKVTVAYQGQPAISAQAQCTNCGACGPTVDCCNIGLINFEKLFDLWDKRVKI